MDKTTVSQRPTGREGETWDDGIKAAANGKDSKAPEEKPGTERMLKKV